MSTLLASRLLGCDVVIASADLDGVVAAAARVETAALRLHDVSAVEGGARARFVAEPGLAIGWSTIAELQVRLARLVPIVRVERLDTLAD